jgi:APA family basic amino acid/polyamine antiporter
MVANGLGVRFGSGIQNLTVFAKIATLVAVTGIAAFFDPETASRDPDVVAAGSSGLGVVALIFAALVPAFFTFGGWQHALWMAGEVRRPRRDVPLSIVVGVLVVIVVYLMVNWAYLELLGYEGVVGSEAIAADAVAVVFPGGGRRLIAGAVAVSAFGVLNAQLLSGPRLLYGMARDGRFFRTFAQVHARFRTPVPAIVLLGLMACTLLVAAGGRGLGQLLAWVVVIDGVFFALTGAALIVLRHKRSEADRPVRVPLYPLVPLLFVAGEVGVVTGAALDPQLRLPALVGAGWIAIAMAFYLIWFRRSGAPGQPV